MRRQDVTASDVAAVCGVDRYRSPLKVWAEKTGAIPPQEDDANMRRGRWLEAAVIEATREERPSWDVRRAGVYLRDPTIRLGATPDAVAVDPAREGVGAVQCKTVRGDLFEQDWGRTDDGMAVAPLGYQLQTLTEAMLIGASWATIVVLVIGARGGAEFYEAPIVRHDAAEARIRRAVARFWAEIDAGRQPPVTYDQDADVVAALHPSDVGTEVDLSTDNRLPVILHERAELAAQVRSLQGRVSEIETEIKAKIGPHERAHVPGWRISWASQARAGHYVPPSTSRVLRISKRK
jgi:predicted phage-related endonuclease